MVAVTTAQNVETDRVLIPGVSWLEYCRLLRIFSRRPGIRLTFDQGDLEIMTLSKGHESVGHLVDRMICVMAEEMLIDLEVGGSTTLRRRTIERGLEPDECYWIKNVHLVREKDKVDLRHDPAPDLAVEVDITSSSLDRMQIYAALGIPEIWRLEKQSVSFLRLDSFGAYQSIDHSDSFPILSPDDLAQFVAQRKTLGIVEVTRRFREWVQQHLSANPPRLTP